MTGAARANPYVGLVPFAEEDADWFFGREREQRIIGANLRASRLTLLYGASGVGKSSVLLASVVPNLRAMVARDRAQLEGKDPQTRRPVRFAVSVFAAWRESPLLGLMTSVAASVHEATGEPVAPWSPGDSVRETFASWLGPVNALLIILDQFEEYFLYHPDDAGPGTFADDFVEVVNDPSLRVNFLLSLREDGLAKLDRFKGQIPGLFENYLRVEHLDRDAARRAIEGPKHEYNLRLEDGAEPAWIDPELVDEVLAEVATDGNGEPHVETPLLQLVMRRLWAAGDTGNGGVRLVPATLRERLGGTENIVLRHLEDALDDLPASQRELAGSVLGQLVSPSKTKIAYPAEDLAHRTKCEIADVQALLLELSTGERRILRSVAPPPDGQDRPVSYEIFHDILAEPILAWCERMEADREKERLKASILEQERARRRQLRKRIVRIGALVLACGLVAVFLVQQRSGRIDASRAAAASALAQLPLDPERSLKLAKEAAETQRTPEAEDALRQALAASRVRAVVREGKSGLQTKACPLCRAMIATPGKPRGASTSRLAISSDGRTVAGVVGDRLWLWSPVTGTSSRPRVGLGIPTGVAFTPDGSRLLAVGTEAAALMARDGSQIVELRGSTYDGATSPDGRHVVTFDASGAVVANVETGKPVARLRGSSGPAAFDGPDALVLQGGEGTLERWRWRSSPTPTRLANAAVAGGAAFSVAPFVAVIPAGPGKAAVVDRRGHVSPLFTSNRVDPVTDAAVSPQATRVLTVRGAKATLWRPTRQWSGPARRVTDLVHGDRVDEAAFSPDGSLVATASIDGAARIWESSNGALAAELRGHATGVQAVAFGPSGRFVATVGEDLTLRLWDLGEARTLRTGSNVVATPVTAGGKIVVLEESGRMRLWDPLKSPEPQLPKPPGLRATSAAVAADGTTVIVGFQDAEPGRGGAALLDLRSGTWRVGGNGDAGVSVASNGDASLVALVDRTGVTQWKPRRGAHEKLPPHVFIEGSTDVAFSADGRRMIATSVLGSAQIIDVATGTVLHVLGAKRAHPGTDSFYRGVFSPDGKTVAIAASRDVRIWNSATGVEFKDARLTGHTGPVTSLAYSADGKRIVTASGDRTTRLWDARSGRLLAVMSHHADRVNSVAFLPDGRIVSGGDDRTVRVYRCDSCGSVDSLLRQARAHLTDPGDA